MSSFSGLRRVAPVVKLLGAAASACLLVLAGGCSVDSSDPGATPPSPGTTPTAAATPGLSASAGYEELSPNWDESPDGPPPVPDSELDGLALVDLLRTRATVRSEPRSCRPEQVVVSLAGFDAAAGHRYTTIVVRNVSEKRCVIEGVPGIGLRGEWGSTFVPAIGRGSGMDGRGGQPVHAVELEPFDAASSDLEWTGELAGAESEHASLLVLQLADGQAPLAIPARIRERSAYVPDIGELTTIWLTPFVRL